MSSLEEYVKVKNKLNAVVTSLLMALTLFTNSPISANAADPGISPAGTTSIGIVRSDSSIAYGDVETLTMTVDGFDSAPVLNEITLVDSLTSGAFSQTTPITISEGDCSLTDLTLVCQLVFTNLLPGTHKFIATYTPTPGNSGTNEPSSTASSVVVAKVQSHIQITTTSPITYGDPETVTIKFWLETPTVLSPTEDSVTVSLDGGSSGSIISKGFTCDEVDGDGVITCTKVITGTHVAESPYTINATYNGSIFVIESTDSDSFIINKRETTIELDLVDNTTNYGESRTPVARVYYYDSNEDSHAVSGNVSFYSTLISESGSSRAKLGQCTLSADGNSSICSITTRQYGKQYGDYADTITAIYEGNSDFESSTVNQEQIVSLNTPEIRIYNTSESSTAWNDGDSSFVDHPDYGDNCGLFVTSADPDSFTAVNPVGCIPGSIHTLYGDLRPLTVTVENSNDVVTGPNSDESDAVWFQPEGSVELITDIPLWNNTPTTVGDVVGYTSSCNLTRYIGYSACTVWVHPSLISGIHEMHAIYTPTANSSGEGYRSTSGGTWSFYDSKTAVAYLEVFRAPSVTTITSVNPDSISTYPESVTVGVKVAGRELDIYSDVNLPLPYYVYPGSVVAACVLSNVSISTPYCGTFIGYQEGVETPTSVSGLNSPYLSGISSGDGNSLAIDGFYGCELTESANQAVCSIEIPFNKLSPTDQNQYYESELTGDPYGLTANYIGNVNYLPSNSDSTNHSVRKTHAFVSIETDAPVSYGESITVTVTVLGAANAEPASAADDHSVQVTDLSTHAFAGLGSLPCTVTDSEYSVGNQSGFQCEVVTDRLHASTLLAGGLRTLKAVYLGNDYYYAGDSATVGVSVLQIPGVFQPGDVSITYGSTPTIPVSFNQPGNDNERAYVLGENSARALLFTLPTCIAQDYMSVAAANGQYVIDCDPATNGQDELAATAYAWDYSFTYDTAILTTTAVRTSEFIINGSVGQECVAILCGSGVQNLAVNYGQIVPLEGYYSFSIGNPGTAPKGTVYFYDNGESTTTTNLVAPDSSNNQPGAIGYCRIDRTSNFISNGTSVFNDCFIAGGFNAGVHNLFAYFLSDDANYLSRWTSNRVVLTVAKADPAVAFNIDVTNINPGNSFTAVTTVSRVADDGMPGNSAFTVHYDQRVAPTGTVKIYRGSAAGNPPSVTNPYLVGTCELVGVQPASVAVYGDVDSCDAVISTAVAGMTANSTAYQLLAVYLGDSNHIGNQSNTDSITVNTKAATMTLTLDSTTAHVGDIDTVTVTVTGQDGYSLAGTVITINANNAATTAPYPGFNNRVCTPVDTSTSGIATCTVTFTVSETGTVTFSAQATTLPTPYSDSATASNVVLNALGAWHTVTYDYNGGTWVSGPTTQRGYQSTILTGPVVTWNGYEFVGWTESGSAVVMTNYSFAADKTVYAKWKTPDPIIPSSPSVVTKVTPVLSWDNPAEITTTTPLSGAQLNAVVTTPAGLAGTYSYSPAAGTLLPAGTQTLSVTFTPTNTTNYSAVSKTVSIVVTAAILPATVSVSGLSAVYDGASHSVGATTSPAGLSVAITYNGSSSAPVNAGTYSVVATITSTGYKGSSNATLTISKATPVITWSNPASVPAGSALSGAQLNATASVPGTFDYSPAAGSSVSQGSNTLDVTFTPSDSTNYSSASASVSVVGVAANLAVTFTPNSSVISTTQLKSISSLVAVAGAKITITGYVQPSKNKATDLRLSLARANAAKAQLLKLYPNANITVVAKGSTINKACSASQNRCVLISVK